MNFEPIAFVPDEICFVLESERALPPGEATDLHGIVDEVLRRKVPDVDLNTLVPLHRRRLITAFLPKENGSAMHLYYRYIAPAGLLLSERNSDVRNLILTLNLALNLHKEPLNLGSCLRIVAVTPNWIGGSCCGGGNDDCPAAPPISVPKDREAQNVQFRFFDEGTGRGNRGLDKLIQDNRKRFNDSGDLFNVVVAVLDTSPTEKVIDDAKKAHRTNLLLQQAEPIVKGVDVERGPHVNPISIAGAICPSAKGFPHLRGVVGNSHNRLQDFLDACTSDEIRGLEKDKYAMPDHGLFAAGIIKDIAPAARIHIVRAVDDKGMTDVNTLADTVTALYEQDWVKKADHVIVSLSVSFATPTYELFDERWLKKYRVRLSLAEKKALYQLMSRNLGDVMDFLRHKGALVVSAAGNYDGPNEPRRKEPRYPAKYESVLAVAALNRACDAPAEYSNPADYEHHTAAKAHGIATIGGDIDWNGGDPVIKDGKTDHPDAVRGIFSAEKLPHDGGNNKSGWVYWIGTSFAAPIIAGIAAVLWADRRYAGYDPARMIKKVLSLRDPTLTQPSLHCDSIFAVQVPV